MTEDRSTMPPLAAYRACEQQLLALRAASNGEETPAEDDLLDEMDALWERLTPAEIGQLDAEGQG